MSEYRKTRVLKRSLEVVGDDNGPSSFDVEIINAGGGEYIRLTGYTETTEEFLTISIDPEDWPHLRKLINTMIKECRK